MTEATLVARVRRSLNDSSGERFSDDTAIADELRAEARSLFSAPDVKSDMLLGVCSDSELVVGTDGTFDPPASYLRICTGYLLGNRIDKVIDAGGLPRPMTAQEIATISHPAFYIEGPNSYVCPPGAYAGVTGTILYVPEDFSLDSVPPSFEDAIVYGAASRLAYNNGEKMLGEILEVRAARHLSRIIGRAMPAEKK